MLRKLGLTVAYVIATLFILSILWPLSYCYSHGCRGPGELDAFMPAFLLTPIGAIATAFTLRDSVQRIRKGKSAFWPLAILFSIVLLCVVALILFVVYHTAFRR